MEGGHDILIPGRTRVRRSARGSLPALAGAGLFVREEFDGVPGDLAGQSAARLPQAASGGPGRTRQRAGVVRRPRGASPAGSEYRGASHLSALQRLLATLRLRAAVHSAAGDSVRRRGCLPGRLEALEPAGPYAEFIERWSSPAFADYVAALRGLAERYPHEAAQEFFNQVLQHERDFWQMSAGTK